MQKRVIFKKVLDPRIQIFTFPCRAKIPVWEMSPGIQIAYDFRLWFSGFHMLIWIGGALVQSGSAFGGGFEAAVSLAPSGFPRSDPKGERRFSSALDIWRPRLPKLCS